MTARKVKTDFYGIMVDDCLYDDVYSNRKEVEASIEERVECGDFNSDDNVYIVYLSKIAKLNQAISFVEI